MSCGKIGDTSCGGNNPFAFQSIGPVLVPSMRTVSGSVARSVVPLQCLLAGVVPISVSNMLLEGGANHVVGFDIGSGVLGSVTSKIAVSVRLPSLRFPRVCRDKSTVGPDDVMMPRTWNR